MVPIFLCHSQTIIVQITGKNVAKYQNITCNCDVQISFKISGKSGQVKIDLGESIFQLLTHQVQFLAYTHCFISHGVSSKIKQCVSHLYLLYTTCTMSFYCSHHVVLLILQKIALSCLDYWCLYRHQCDLPERFGKK